MTSLRNAVLIAAAAAMATPALAQTASPPPDLVDRYMSESWKSATPEWRGRLAQDQTMKDCSTYRNNPPAAVHDAIIAREKATIQYPADGKLLGDWKKGEASARDGYGLRFTDKDTARANGGNCYACHQLDPKEITFGTVGPSLVHYRKNRNYSTDDAKLAYERIFNPQSVLACSHMPRFGHNKFLTVDQIKDVLAYLMDPASPVNK